MRLPQPSGGFTWTQAPWGQVLRCSPLAAITDHLFTTADIALREDEREWSGVARAMDVPLEKLLLIRQVHRTDVAIARAGRSGMWDRPEADIIISNDPAAAIAVRVADCAPVLIADRMQGVVGAAHAGWRGTVQRAGVVAVQAMEKAFGSKPEDLMAAIGPCLGPCCGEVGPEVIEAFRTAGHGDREIDRWFTTGPSDRPYLDLWRANADQLEAAGVLRENIHVARLCTKTHAALLHSYRVKGAAVGRMVGAIRARPR